MIQLHIQSETIQGNLSQESGGQALGDNPLFGHFLSGLMELPGDQNFEEVNTLYRKGFIHFELNLISKEQMDQLETDVEEGLQQNPLNLMSTGSMFTSFEEENTQRKEVLPFGDFNLESGSAPSFLNAILSDFKPTESRFEAVTMGSENEEMEGVANRVLQKMAGLMNALTDFKLESPMGEGDRAEFVVQGFQLRWSELKISLSDSLSDLPKNSEKLALVETNKEEAFLEESNPLQLGIQNWIIEWKGTEQEQLDRKVAKLENELLKSVKKYLHGVESLLDNPPASKEELLQTEQRATFEPLFVPEYNLQSLHNQNVKDWSNAEAQLERVEDKIKVFFTEASEQNAPQAMESKKPLARALDGLKPESFFYGKAQANPFSSPLQEQKLGSVETSKEEHLQGVSPMINPRSPNPSLLENIDALTKGTEFAPLKKWAQFSETPVLTKANRVRNESENVREIVQTPQKVSAQNSPFTPGVSVATSEGPFQKNGREVEQSRGVNQGAQKAGESFAANGNSVLVKGLEGALSMERQGKTPPQEGETLLESAKSNGEKKLFVESHGKTNSMVQGEGKPTSGAGNLNSPGSVSLADLKLGKLDQGIYEPQKEAKVSQKNGEFPPVSSAMVKTVEPSKEKTLLTDRLSLKSFESSFKAHLSENAESNTKGDSGSFKEESKGKEEFQKREIPGNGQVSQKQNFNQHLSESHEIKEQKEAFTNLNTSSATSSVQQGSGSQGTSASVSSQFQVIAQIEEHLEQMQKLGKNRMVLRLNPDNLGRVEVRLEMHKDQMIVKMKVEEESVKKVLDKQMVHLKENLEQQHVQLEKAEVNLFTEQKNQQWTGAEQRQAQQRKEGRDRSNKQKQDEGNQLEEKEVRPTTRQLGYNTMELTA